MRRGWLLGMLLLGGGACAAQKGDGEGLKLLQTVPLPGVEGRFDHFALDGKGGRLFLAALGNNTLELLDTKTGRRLRSVTGMKEPQGVAYAPDLQRVFVGNGEGGTCDLLDGNGLERVGQVAGMEDADNVRYDAAAKRVYVGYGSRTHGGLGVIDSASGKRVGTIPLAGHPESFQLEKNGPRIWVNMPDARQIAVVDRRQEKVVETWPVTGARANFPMALDEAHHRLLVGCREPARLLVYDTELGKQVGSAEIVGDTDDLFLDAARKRLYVAGGEGFFAPDLDRFFLAVPHRGSQRAEVRVYTPQE